MSDRLTPEREAERVQGLLYEAITAFQNVAHLSSLQHAQMRGYLAGHLTPTLLAELAAVRAERDQARRDAELQRAAYFHEAARLLEDAGRDDDAVNLLDNVANGIRANVDAIETARNAIRQSYRGLIAQAEQDRDPEGVAHLQDRLRDREAQWKRDDEAGESR